MLQAIHIRKQFQRSGEVLRDVSFTLGDGEFLSVIGPSRRETEPSFVHTRMERSCAAAVKSSMAGRTLKPPEAGKSGRSSRGSAPSIRISVSWKIPPALQMCSLPVCRIWDFSPLCSESTEKSAGQKH